LRHCIIRHVRILVLISILVHLSFAGFPHDRISHAKADSAPARETGSPTRQSPIHDIFYKPDAEPGAFGNRVAAIARAQLGRGPLHVGSERDTFPFDLGRRLRPGEAWCSEFVSWAYVSAGRPLVGGRDGWMIKNSRGLRAWFRTHSFFVGRDDPFWEIAAPSPGDYIRYHNDKGGHSGLVYAADSATMRTIEGNVRNRVVMKTLTNWRQREDIDGIGLQNRRAIAQYLHFIQSRKQKSVL
jgi:hypothetical protein